MAWTQTDLDSIEAAIASGELTVQYVDFYGNALTVLSVR